MEHFARHFKLNKAVDLAFIRRDEGVANIVRSGAWVRVRGVAHSSSLPAIEVEIAADQNRSDYPARLRPQSITPTATAAITTTTTVVVISQRRALHTFTDAPLGCC